MPENPGGGTGRFHPVRDHGCDRLDCHRQCLQAVRLGEHLKSINPYAKSTCYHLLFRCARMLKVSLPGHALHFHSHRSVSHDRDRRTRPCFAPPYNPDVCRSDSRPRIRFRCEPKQQGVQEEAYGSQEDNFQRDPGRIPFWAQGWGRNPEIGAGLPG